MSLPESIQRQLDESEALEALMAGEPDTPETEEPEAQQEEIPEPEVEKPVAPPRDGNWEHKYKSLEGKYNSQVPSLQQELNSTKSQIQSLTSELEKLKEKQPEPSKSQEVAEDEELVGSDIVKAAERAAARAIAKVQAKLDVLETENAKLKAELGQVSEHQSSFAGQDFFSKLDSAIPDWRSVEATEQGQEFLKSRIPGTGQTWDQALKAAANAYNLEETVEIFNELVRRNPELRAPAKPKPQLEKQVTPNKSKNPAPAETKKVWTAKDWEGAWNEIAKRVVTGTEASDLEKELEAAMAEGRVR